MKMRMSKGKGSRSRARGFSLMELMISLVLGLVVVGAAGAIFSSNKRTFNATETLGRIQENGRVAFELMARDVREAGGTPCGKNIPIANVLNAGGGNFDWGTGVTGYGPGDAAANAPFGTGAGQRVAGTDAVELRSADSAGVSVSSHQGANTKLAVLNHGFQDGDIVMMCDYASAAIFQISNASATNVTIVHNKGNGTPGNQCFQLGFPACAGDPGKNGKSFAPNARIAKYNVTTWYVGFNGRGGRSLYRRILGQVAEEVTEGVETMGLAYLVPGNRTYQAAAAIPVTAWTNVNALRVSLGLQGAVGAMTAAETQGTTAGVALGRQLVHTVTMRNRMP